MTLPWPPNGLVMGPRWILHDVGNGGLHREGEPCDECDKPKDLPAACVVVKSVDRERGVITFGGKGKP